MSDAQLGIDSGNVLWADGIRTLATITESTDYAEGVRRESVAQFEKRGGEVVAEERYPSDTTDFRTYLTRLLNENPDAIHLAAQGEFSGGTIGKQLRELGYDGPLYSEVVPVGATALEIAGDAATGLKAIVAELDPANVKAQEVLASFRERYGYVMLSWYLGSAYDDVYITAECLKRTDDDQDADGFRDCLYDITWSGAIGLNYSFDENGEVVGPTNMVVRVLPASERTEANRGYRVIGPAPTAAPTATLTPEPTASTVSFEEYLSMCEVLGGDDEPLKEDATNKELSGIFAEALAGLEAVIPPAEVAEWHNKLLSVLQNVIDILDQLPEDDTIDFGTALLVALTVQADMEEVEANLPDDVRRQMVSAGCIEGTSIEGTSADRFDEPEVLVGTFGVGESVRVGDYLVELTDAYMEDAGTVSLEVTIQNAGGSPVPMPDWDTQMSLQDQDGYRYDRASASRNALSDQISPDATVYYSLAYVDVPEDAVGLTWKFSDGVTGAAFDLTGIGLLQASIETDEVTSTPTPAPTAPTVEVTPTPTPTPTPAPVSPSSPSAPGGTTPAG